MAWTRATAAALPEVVRYLRRDPGGALFPLANLAHHGIEGAHPHAMEFWLNRDARQALSGVVGITRSGMLLPVSCDAGQPRELAALRGLLRGREFIGGSGRVHALRPLLDALVPQEHPRELDADEAAFRLDLDHLRMPATEGLRLRAIEAGDRDLLIRWRAEGRIESLGTPRADAEAAARRDVAQFLDADTHRLLLKGDEPVAMTGFNARLDEIVQIGAVYTPANLRTRGYARAAVALHLQQARAEGAHCALLFTNSEPARRAYTALGFDPNGAFALVLFGTAQPGCVA